MARFQPLDAAAPAKERQPIEPQKMTSDEYGIDPWAVVHSDGGSQVEDKSPVSVFRSVLVSSFD